MFIKLQIALIRAEITLLRLRVIMARYGLGGSLLTSRRLTGIAEID